MEGFRHLWFRDGSWWFTAIAEQPPLAISCILRRCAYHAEAIARELRLGERTFHRYVKDSLGLPPGLWLRSERAVDARRRLSAGHSIKELAFEYGFKHQGDFTDEFKRWYGISPAEYRRVESTRH